jgi:hypothetical protein
MAKLELDEAHWAQVIARPTWYLDYVKLAQRAKQEWGEDSDQTRKLKKKVRHFFEQKLEAGQVAIATDGPDLDAQRQPIDTIVVHHTSHTPGYRLSYLNAVHLLNIYAPYFANPTLADEKSLKGRPIWSGHFSGNRQVFWGYHWLMRMDGSFERLLNDKQIGWHAGNWDVNTRSIGICIDNDYEAQDPTDEVLAKLAGHIKQHYPGTKIIGHCEARAGTICPGAGFIGGWKLKLLKYLA